MRQYASWQAPFYSFWSKTFYIDVAKNWHGYGYRYLFLLICFTSLFLFIDMTVDLASSQHEINNDRVTKSEYTTKSGEHVTTVQRVTTYGGNHSSIDFGLRSEANLVKPSKGHYAIRFSLMDFVFPMNDDIGYIIQQIPTRVIMKNGILSINCPSPYTIKDASGQTVITFDTRNNTKSLSEGGKSFVVLTKDTVFLRGPLAFDSDIDNILKFHYASDFAKNIPLANVGNGTIEMRINKLPDANHWFAGFKREVILLIYAIFVPFSFFICVLQSLIYGLIGIGIAKLSKIQMSYGTLVRLATVALTPGLLIDSILKLCRLNIEIWSFLAFVIAIGYLRFAIQANKISSEPKLESIKI